MMVRESPHNLLSKAGLQELETRHIPECVRFALRLPGSGPLLDVGSGGGLPGVVIAIVRPDLEVHLLEATTKKATFLEDVNASLHLGATIHNVRAEDAATGSLRGRFTVVTARAVARLDRLVALCEPFLAPRGQLWAIKGERWSDEVPDSEAVMRRCGLRILSTPADQPDQDPRVVVIGR